MQGMEGITSVGLDHMDLREGFPVRGDGALRAFAGRVRRWIPFFFFLVPGGGVSGCEVEDTLLIPEGCVASDLRRGRESIPDG